MSDATPEFSEIYDAYHGKVVAYAARLLGRDEADDVAQEVFVKVRRSLSTLEDASKLASWIYAITLNTVRDAARRRVPAPVRRDSDASDATPDVPDAVSRTPEENAIRSEMVSCYLDYVNQLPDNYRDVYVLSEFEHLSNEEIARRSGLTLGTAKIRLHRARARIQQELRRNCRCYYNERGELMGEPVPPAENPPTGQKPRARRRRSRA